MTRACFAFTGQMIDLTTMANYIAMNCAYLEKHGMDISEYERQLNEVAIKFNECRNSLRRINDQISDDYTFVKRQ